MVFCPHNEYNQENESFSFIYLFCFNIQFTMKQVYKYEPWLLICKSIES